MTIDEMIDDAPEEIWEEAHEWGGECEFCGGDGVREYQESPDEWDEDIPTLENHLIPCRGCEELRQDKRRWVARRIGLEAREGGKEE